MTIYIDSDFKCHVTGGGMMRAIETDFFDGRCNEFIEGYRYVPAGETWTREDGETFTGEMITPWRNYSELAEIQAAVDRTQAQAQQMIDEYEQALSEIEIALGVTSK